MYQTYQIHLDEVGLSNQVTASKQSLAFIYMSGYMYVHYAACVCEYECSLVLYSSCS